MCVRNRFCSLIFKIFIFICCGLGLFLNSGFLQGGGWQHFFLSFKYYTSFSLLICFFYYLVISVLGVIQFSKHGIKGTLSLSSPLKGGIVLALLTTLFVYQFLLSGQPFSVIGKSNPFANALVHLILPILVVLDWALFDPKGRFHASDPLAWLTIPLGYYALTVLASLLGVTFVGGASAPYPFINPDTLGWMQVLTNVLVLCVVFLLMAYLFFGIDHFLGWLTKQKSIEELQKKQNQLSDEDFVTEAPADASKITPPASFPLASFINNLKNDIPSPRKTTASDAHLRDDIVNDSMLNDAPVLDISKPNTRTNKVPRSKKPPKK